MDDHNNPLRSEWFDSNQRAIHTLILDGRQVVDGYDLPQRIDLTGGKGGRVTVVL